MGHRMIRVRVSLGGGLAFAHGDQILFGQTFRHQGRPAELATPFAREMAIQVPFATLVATQLARACDTEPLCQTLVGLIFLGHRFAPAIHCLVGPTKEFPFGSTTAYEKSETLWELPKGSRWSIPLLE